MTIDKHTPIYVAPANPAGKALADRLLQLGYNIAGMADNLKQGQNIINNAAKAQPDAIVVIAAGSFLHAVASGLLLRGFSKTQLWTTNSGNDVKTYKQPLSYRFKQAGTELLTLTFNILRRFIPRAGYLYYAEDFFDSNVLLAYREHRRQFPNEAWLLGRKLNQHIAELQNDGHALEGLSWKSLLCCMQAKKLIVDHEYTGKTFSLLRQAIPVIQLWHGLPYKALSGNIHYPHICDEAFISSSEWFNQHIFPKIFRAKHYLALGYPRNDALLQPAKQRDWINTEPLSLLREVQQNTGDIVVYAPTYRDWGDNDYPLDLPELNRWCQQHNISFVLKFHPFISRKFSDAMQLHNSNDLQAIPGLPHIYLYPSGKNIYPWLADAKVLITDYSSIAYDFLLAAKPVVYYQYDLEQYKQLRGKTLVSDEDFIAGAVVCNQAELQQQLAQLLNDGEAAQQQQTRTALTEKFMLNSTPAVEIVGYIRHCPDSQPITKPPVG